MGVGVSVQAGAAEGLAQGTCVDGESMQLLKTAWGEVQSMKWTHAYRRAASYGGVFA